MECNGVNVGGHQSGRSDYTSRTDYISLIWFGFDYKKKNPPLHSHSRPLSSLQLKLKPHLKRETPSEASLFLIRKPVVPLVSSSLFASAKPCLRYSVLLGENSSYHFNPTLLELRFCVQSER
ncbi:hypothetical protein PRUPE_6G070400 [Prunus persica]|uniref:Uncharacterized protein n=1 Tax=Prunus persica TaxID=3760 RepID=A0A251NP35_PRUPE|nr:hypothetical protein PRUPE_6G070400 [Prunus persica]